MPLGNPADPNTEAFATGLLAGAGLREISQTLGLSRKRQQTTGAQPSAASMLTGQMGDMDKILLLAKLQGFMGGGGMPGGMPGGAMGAPMPGGPMGGPMPGPMGGPMGAPMGAAPMGLPMMPRPMMPGLPMGMPAPPQSVAGGLPIQLLRQLLSGAGGVV